MQQYIPIITSIIGSSGLTFLFSFILFRKRTKAEITKIIAETKKTQAETEKTESETLSIDIENLKKMILTYQEYYKDQDSRIQKLNRISQNQASVINEQNTMIIKLQEEVKQLYQKIEEQCSICEYKEHYHKFKGTNVKNRKAS